MLPDYYWWSKLLYTLRFFNCAGSFNNIKNELIIKKMELIKSPFAHEIEGPEFEFRVQDRT